jgi:hypothetical protein
MKPASSRAVITHPHLPPHLQNQHQKLLQTDLKNVHLSNLLFSVLVNDTGYAHRLCSLHSQPNGQQACICGRTSELRVCSYDCSQAGLQGAHFIGKGQLYHKSATLPFCTSTLQPQVVASNIPTLFNHHSITFGEDVDKSLFPLEATGT